MFCGQCGTKNLEVARFCENCGNPLKEERVTTQPTVPVTYYTEPVKSSSGKAGLIAAIIGSIVTIVAAVAVVVFLIFGGGPETPIKDMIKAINRQNPDLMIQTYPKELEALIKVHADAEESFYQDLIWELQESNSYMEETCGDGDYTYEILDKRKLSEAELAEARINYADTVESWYGYYTDAEITDGYEMVVDIVYEGEYGHDKNNEILYVYKVNGKWSRIDVY